LDDVPATTLTKPTGRTNPEERARRRAVDDYARAYSKGLCQKQQTN
jgi:hypothetical protein